MRRIYWIALSTFRESVRSRVLYSLLFFAVLLIAVSTFFGTVTIGDQVKVIKDFGLFAISFFTVAYAVISGSALLHKELSRKTVFNILAKPVRRSEFLCGKYFGMLATVSLMLALMVPALALYTTFFERRFDPLVLEAGFFIWLQLIIVCGVAMLFSSIVVTPMLSGAFTFGVFLAGRSTEYLKYLVRENELEGAAAGFVQGVYWLLPHLNLLDISNQVVYGVAVAGPYVLWSAVYAGMYAAVLLTLAAFFFRNREFI